MQLSAGHRPRDRHPITWIKTMKEDPLDLDKTEFFGKIALQESQSSCCRPQRRRE